MIFDPEEILASYGPGDPARFLVAADAFLIEGKKRLAASALDRAFALAPTDPGIARQRASVLAELAVTVHGLAFRYVPAGTFLMGSPSGDPDERPVHPRRLDAFWIAEVPISWGAYCRLLDYEPPPAGAPKEGPELEGVENAGFALYERNKIRLQYCEDETLAARDWHAHAGMDDLGPIPRADPEAPPTYERKPMVAVSPADAEELADALSTEEVVYALPSEAEWEKAARGGLEGARYPWGDAPPTPARCDFDHMGEYRLRDPRDFPPNGYGLYGMCGGVMEWTSDPYDALAYHRAARGDLSRIGPASGAHVLRGGSFTDCAEAVTVSFRAARADAGWRSGSFLSAATPNVGFRLVRRVR